MIRPPVSCHARLPDANTKCGPCAFFGLGGVGGGFGAVAAMRAIEGCNDSEGINDAGAFAGGGVLTIRPSALTIKAVGTGACGFACDTACGTAASLVALPALPPDHARESGAALGAVVGCGAGGAAVG